MTQEKIKSLEYKLNNIKKIFDTDDLINIPADLDHVKKYYKINQLAYTLFHNKLNFMHLGISYNQKYKKDDLYVQVKFISKYIKSLNKKYKKRILELGSGKGGNSIYLSKIFPETEFIATDLTKENIDFSRKKIKNLKNLSFDYADYHDLSKFPKNSFDIVFVIEALCYSNNKIKVFLEVKRILKKGGYFIIIDGYANDNKKKLTESEKLAMKLTEKGMAVEKSETYKNFLEIAKKSKLKIVHEIDWTQNILPSLIKFEKMQIDFLGLSL
jgi:arsenite methyltransferase